MATLLSNVKIIRLSKADIIDIVKSHLENYPEYLDPLMRDNDVVKNIQWDEKQDFVEVATVRED